jgi:hypothetical protein
MSDNRNNKEEEAPKSKADYYSKGSAEIATETPLTINRLETVRKFGIIDCHLLLLR